MMFRFIHTIDIRFSPRALSILLPLAILACLTVPAMETAKANPIYQWRFEEGAEGWISPDSEIAVIERSSIRPGEDGNALALRFDGNERSDATISLTGPFNWVNGHVLDILALVPSNAPDDLRIAVYAIDDDHHWFQTVQLFESARGRWSRMRIDVSPASVEWAPQGHFRPWSSDVSKSVSEFGVKAFSRRKWAGDVVFASISVTPRMAHSEPLRILNFQTNTNRVPRYGLFEITFELTRSYDNPFDPDEIDITGIFIAPDGEITTVPGFYFQDYRRQMEMNREVLIPIGRGKWKIRFAPQREGDYRFAISVNDGDRLATEPRTFTSVPSENPGFLRVSGKDWRYFEFDNGDFFYPIGHNIPATYNVKAADILGLQALQYEGTFAYDRFMSGMGENGENFARIWMSCWSFAIEWSSAYENHYKGLGRYSMENAWKLDYVVEKAERNDIYIQLALSTFGHFRTGGFEAEGNWEHSPYNVMNGGFLRRPDQFWSDDRAWQYYSRMLRYISARWGYSANIASWELSNEIDLVTNFNQERANIIQWHRKCAEVFRRYDQGRHMITTNFASWQRDNDILSLPEISYSSTNRYQTDVITALEEIYNLKSQLRKPALIAECGEDFKGSPPETTERYIQVSIWSSYMMPLAGAGMQWWWDFIDDRDLYYYFKPLAMFAEGEDQRNKGLEIAPARLVKKDSIERVPGLAARCLKNDNEAFLWIYETALVGRTLDIAFDERADVEVILSEFRQGDYRVEFWDTFQGGIIDEYETSARDGNVTFAVPPFRSNIAVKVKPID